MCSHNSFHSSSTCIILIFPVLFPSLVYSDGFYRGISFYINQSLIIEHFIPKNIVKIKFFLWMLTVFSDVWI